MEERQNVRKFILFLVLIFVVGASLFVGDFLSFWEDIFEKLPDPQEKIPVLVEKAKEQISAPAPLIVEIRVPESFLTQTGVIQWTNIQRKKEGLPLLRESPELTESAMIKIQDMLFQQYFAHISPLGEGVGDLATRTGYEFVAIGENLALGDFENDEKLVQAWMASPGHRENILNPQYQEIGVAVLQGEFQGRTTWVAVQHFGKPLSSCPKPGENILLKITKNKTQIEQLYFTLSGLETELSALRQKGDFVEYNQKVKEYNSLISNYNALIDETKSLVEQYNNQVILFNTCVKG